MAEKARKKKLSIAVLAAPALAFGSITFATGPAIAVPLNQVQEILAEDGVDTVLLYAPTEIPAQSDDEDAEPLAAGSLERVNINNLDGEAFEASNGETYLLEPFDHASVEQYEAEGLPVPSSFGSSEEQEPEDEEPVASEEPTEPEVPVEPEEDSQDLDTGAVEIDPQVLVDGEWNNIRPGHTVTISGTGFTPNGDVTLSLNDESFATATADVYGAFEVSEQIPLDLGALIDWQFEEFPLVATDSVSGESVTYLLTLYPVFDRLVPEISADRTEAEIGDTIRFTVDNFDELLTTHVGEDDDFEITMQGTIEREDGLRDGFSAGIERVTDADNPYTFEFIIPASIEAYEETVTVRSGTYLDFFATLTVNPAGASPEYYTSWSVFVDISGEEDENAVAVEEPALTVDPAEITLEDFVGDPDEGAGVLHELTGVAPGTAVDFEVDTPEGVAPFSASDTANEAGEVQLHIYGESNTSAYVGDYTTVATFEDGDGETQELSVDFSVIENPEDTVTPVVDTEEVATEDETQTPAIGGQLADTGANGTSLMWIAGGLLALGGAFVIYANRARLFGRKN